MRGIRRFWSVAAIVTAGFLSACGDNAADADCLDYNENGICDIEEPGHGVCPVRDRDENGECSDEWPKCKGTQILIADACEDCPGDEIAKDNVCVTPPLTCGTNEIIVDEACVPCEDDATATNNVCVPHCTTTQILVENVCEDCPAGDVVQDNECVPPAASCDDGEVLVGGVCETCPAGEIADDNACVACGTNEIVIENACVACEDDETATNGVCVPNCTTTQILVENVCQDCDAGEINDGSDVCCEDFDFDGLCDSDPADDCFGLNNGEDVDGDGFCSDLDCDDADKHTYPGASEICGLPVVNDCDNPCYDDVCDAADLSAAKDGKVGEYIHGVVAQWSDVTADVVGAGQVYETSGERSLNFCGAGPFHVDLRTSGDSNRLTVQSGLEQGPAPALTADGENRPVAAVRDGGYVTVDGVSLEHSPGFAGDKAHGLYCAAASFMLHNAAFNNNSAQQGGGVHAKGCDFDVLDSVDFHSNTAKEGSAFFITGGSKSESKSARLAFANNVTENTDSAALHVEEESIIQWNLAADQPRASFKENHDGDSLPRDIRVSSGARLEIRDADFTTSSVDHVRTDDSTHIYATPVDLACTSTLCSP